MREVGCGRWDVGDAIGDVGCDKGMWDVGCCRKGAQEGLQAGRAARRCGRALRPLCRIAHGQQRRILSFRRGAILRPAGSRMQTKGGEGGRGREKKRDCGACFTKQSPFCSPTLILCAFSQEGIKSLDPARGGSAGTGDKAGRTGGEQF